MKTKIYLLLILVPGLLFAQKKVVAPPTRITLPSDTARVVPSSSKISTPDTTITVPDVLILGTDKTSKNVDNKLDFTQESPTLYKPELDHDPVSKMISSEQNKPGFKQSSSSMQRMSWAELSGGGFSTITANAGYWQRIKKGDFRVNGKFNRSSGQHENSDYILGGLGGNLHYIASPNVKSTSFANIQARKLGMHQYLARTDIKRSIKTLNAGSEWFYNPGAQSDAKIGLEISNLSITDDSTNTVNRRDQFHYKLLSEYVHHLQYFQFKGFGDFSRDSDDLDSQKNKTHFGELGLEISGQPIQQVNLSAGFKYQNFDSELLNSSISKSAPFAKINFMPLKNLGTSLQYYSGFQYTPLTNWLNKNPYLIPQSSSTINELNYAFQFDLQFEPVAGIHLFTNFDYKSLDNYIYWSSADTVLNQISLNSMSDLDLLELNIGGYFNINDKSRLQVKFTKYQPSMNDTTRFSHDNVPYLPEYQVPVKLIVEPISGTTITVDATITGKRYFSSLQNETLDAYTLFNIAVQQSFGKISANLQIRNLFDSDYSYWYNYPQNGVHILAGVSARF